MERWGAALYGDPCAGCGYKWSVSPHDAVDLVEGLLPRCVDLLHGRTGRERHPELGWDVTAYLCHAADNMRIWAEGLTGARLSGDPRVAGYDPDLLAEARRYGSVSLAAASWSLDRTVPLWSAAVLLALDAGVVLQHASRGEQRAEDVARNNAHDVFHHRWDIERTLRLYPSVIDFGQ